MSRRRGSLVCCSYKILFLSLSIGYQRPRGPIDFECLARAAFGFGLCSASIWGCPFGSCAGHAVERTSRQVENTSADAAGPSLAGGRHIHTPRDISVANQTSSHGDRRGPSCPRPLTISRATATTSTASTRTRRPARCRSPSGAPRACHELSATPGPRSKSAIRTSSCR